jgi:hypothetical protein
VIIPWKCISGKKPSPYINNLFDQFGLSFGIVVFQITGIRWGAFILSLARANIPALVSEHGSKSQYVNNSATTPICVAEDIRIVQNKRIHKQNFLDIHISLSI